MPVTHCPDVKTASPIPAVSTELFVIPLEPGRYVLYTPLRRSAFAATARVVNFLADVQAGRYDEAADPDASRRVPCEHLVGSSRQLEFDWVGI